MSVHLLKLIYFHWNINICHLQCKGFWVIKSTSISLLLFLKYASRFTKAILAFYLPISTLKRFGWFQVPDELEGVTNGTLSNIIRQLSSLSRHAEEIFGNLFRDAENVASRSSNLQAKIDRLAIRVTQLDSTVEEGIWMFIEIHHDPYLSE